jgi:ABC-2 type transport system ATP-binding protein
MVGGPGLVGSVSARANLIRHARLGGDARTDAARAADAALAADGLDRLGSTPARRLSHGERQRVALAAAFLGTPRLLVLDEPTEGLDPLAMAALRERLAAAHHAGTTIVIASHLLSEVEQLATHCAVLAQGRVRLEGVVSELGGGAGRLRLRATPTDRAVEVLGAAGCAVSLHGDGTLIVTAPAADAPALVAKLVREGVAVQEVAPVRVGLEGIYRTAIGAP